MSSILVVEDEDYIQTFIKEVLEPQGQVVVTTSSAKEALRLCQQQSFDLVITDLWMPDMDGLELIRTLRQSHPKLPILAISGRSDNLLKMSTALGAVGTLQKPFKPRDLLAGVDKVLGKQPA